ncbi:hypothetical protein LZ32DRAFT_611803 [Colletotrichum eremochloae]|nr:hypothetical protein LZ32DRAFT_611803 [Colletotrichum eremochloae]
MTNRVSRKTRCIGLAHPILSRDLGHFSSGGHRIYASDIEAVLPGMNPTAHPFRARILLGGDGSWKRQKERKISIASETGPDEGCFSAKARPCRFDIVFPCRALVLWSKRLAPWLSRLSILSICMHPVRLTSTQKESKRLGGGKYRGVIARLPRGRQFDSAPVSQPSVGFTISSSLRGRRRLGCWDMDAAHASGRLDETVCVVLFLMTCFQYSTLPHVTRSDMET